MRRDEENARKNSERRRLSRGGWSRLTSAASSSGGGGRTRTALMCRGQNRGCVVATVCRVAPATMMNRVR